MHVFTSSYTLRMSEKFPVHVPAALHWDSVEKELCPPGTGCFTQINYLFPPQVARA